MDFEKLLLTKTAQTGKIDNILLSGIEETHFFDNEHKNIYNYLKDHYRTYKQSPSFQTVREEFPLYNFELTNDSIEYLKSKFLIQVKRRYATEAIRELASCIDNPSLVEDIDSLFLEKSRSLSQIIPHPSVDTFIGGMEERINKYESGEDLHSGIKMGIPEFDDLTLGIQPHEFVSILGFSSIGKSTLGQMMVFNAWTQNKKPMYVSLEMENKALLRKWDTMLMNFDYNRFKSNQLTEPEINSWRNKYDELKHKENDIICLDDVRRCTPDKIYAEMVRWKPDICCIDYLSLMDSGRANSINNSWEKIMYLTQTLKQISRTLKIPIIGIAQTNRSSKEVGAQLDNVGGSISVVQDSDIVLGLYSNDDMKQENKMEVRMLKNRDGMTMTTNLFWNPSKMEFGEWHDTYAFNTP